MAEDEFEDIVDEESGEVTGFRRKGRKEPERAASEISESGSHARESSEELDLDSREHEIEPEESRERPRRSPDGWAPESHDSESESGRLRRAGNVVRESGRTGAAIHAFTQSSRQVFANVVFVIVTLGLFFFSGGFLSIWLRLGLVGVAVILLLFMNAPGLRQVIQNLWGGENRNVLRNTVVIFIIGLIITLAGYFSGMFSAFFAFVITLVVTIIYVLLHLDVKHGRINFLYYLAPLVLMTITAWVFGSPWAGIVGLLAGCIWLGWEKQSIGVAVIVGIVSVVLFLVILSLISVEEEPEEGKVAVDPNSRFGRMIALQQELWFRFIRTFRDVPGRIKQFGQRQVAIYSEDIQIGKVDKYAVKKMGLFLDNVGTDSKRVFVPPEQPGRFTEPILVYGELSLEGFEDSAPVNVRITCHAENLTGNVSGLVRPDDSFVMVHGDPPIDIGCVINPRDLSDGQYMIVIDVAFNFKTEAYMRGYFMEQTRLRAYTREKTDPLAEFGISDKDPKAVFTSGPVGIGVGLGSLPVPVAEDMHGPTVKITVEDLWEGRLGNVESFSFKLPPGLAVTAIEGKNRPGCDSACGTSDPCICALQRDDIDSLFSKKQEIAGISTLRINTDVKDAAVLLGNAPLAIRNIEVAASYTYNLQELVPVAVYHERVQP